MTKCYCLLIQLNSLCFCLLTSSLVNFVCLVCLNVQVCVYIYCDFRHMQEHLNANIDTSKMTEQELQFHYFKMHDADNNNKLDGCELIKSLIHWHGKSNLCTLAQ